MKYKPSKLRAIVSAARYKFVPLVSTALIVLAPISARLMPAMHTVSTSGAYSASDLLGQLDTSGNPVFNSYTENYDPTQTLTPSSVVPGTGMDAPTSVAIDSTHHRLFVADVENNRILVYALNASNQVTSLVAANVLGQPDLTSTSTGTAANQLILGYNSELHYDAASNLLFVADSRNNRVLVFDLSSGITNGMNAAHVLGQPDFTSNSSATTGGGMNYPAGITYDSGSKQLFVADSNNYRVLVFDLSSGITNGMNAAHVLGQPDFTTATYHYSPSSVTNSAGLAYDPVQKRLFVLNLSRISVFDFSSGITNNMDASYALGQPDLNSGNSRNTSQNNISAEGGIYYDTTQQRLFVADTDASRVTIFDFSSGITNNMNASYVLGQPDFTSRNYNITKNGLAYPMDVSYDATSGQLAVVDRQNNRVMMFDLSSGITNNMDATAEVGQSDAGTGDQIFTQSRDNNSNGIPPAPSYGPSNRNLKYPEGTAVDSVHHRLFVADEANNRVLEYELDSNNNLVDRLADHVLGQADFTHGMANRNGTAAANTLYAPVSPVYDAGRNILFVTDRYNHRVLSFDLSSGITNGMNASHVLGQADFTGSDYNYTGSPDSTDLYSPAALAYDPATKNLYVADQANRRVLVFNTTTITNGMSATHVLGQPDFTSTSDQSSRSGMGRSFSLAIDSERHKLYVGDNDNGRTLVFDIGTLSDGMDASNVLGESDFNTSDPWDTTTAGSNTPYDLAYDSVHQRLFIGDDSANRILIFDTSSVTDGQDGIAVLGQISLTDDNYDCNPSATTICDPEGMSDYFDTLNQRLYLSDSSDNRVLIFNFAKLTDAPAATAGSAYSQSLGSQTQGVSSYSVTSGSLPAGLTLNASTGVLSGTPTAAGSYNFAVHVSDDNGVGGTYTDDHNYSFTVQTASASSSSGSSSGTKAKGKIVPALVQTDSTAVASNVINLDDQPTFEDGTGYTMSIGTGQQYTFSLDGAGGSAQQHTITVNSTDISNSSDPTVTVTVHSDPITVVLHNGAAQSVDVDGDGINDIKLLATNITASGATLSISKLVAATTTGSNSGGASQSIQATDGKSKHGNTVALVVGAVIVVVVASVLVTIRKTRRA